MGGDFRNLGRGAKRRDFKICGDELILDILELQKKSKKKILGVYIGNFETYSRYSRVADEEQKKDIGVIAFLNSLKGTILKEFGKP